MTACDAVRRAAGPHRQVQPFLSGCGLGSRRFSRASTGHVWGAAAIPPCAANCQQPDAVRESRSCHRSEQPLRLTRCRTPRPSPISRSLARADAKKRPSNRSPPSLSIRLCQLRALQFSRSKILASSAESLSALANNGCMVSASCWNRSKRRKQRSSRPFCRSRWASVRCVGGDEPERGPVDRALRQSDTKRSPKLVRATGGCEVVSIFRVSGGNHCSGGFGDD
jgi:hypothetical protein